MSHRESAPAIKAEKCRLMEVIGPAGAGKTSLYASLGESSAQIRLSDFPDVHKIADAPFFIRYGLQLLPSLARYSGGGSRQFSRREFAWMSVLVGWPNRLHGQFQEDPRVIVLDQGPVYLLAEMREFGPEYMRGEKADPFWQQLFQRWAQTLDLLVWLDADDATLMERIRSREQEHIVKNETGSKMTEFIDCYRRIFDTTVSALKTYNPGLKVLRFDTGKWTTNEIRDEILSAAGYAE